MAVPVVWSKVAAIVTGGASGLGRATATRLARRGARVVLADMNDEAGEATAAAINAACADGGGGMARYVHTDVTSVTSVTAALDALETLADAPVNVVVNCAGIAVARKTLSRDKVHPLDEFQRVIAVNVGGSFNVASQAAARMAARGTTTAFIDDATPATARSERGVIINTASVAAYDGQIGQVAYASSKGAIVGLTLPLARDLAASHVRVVAIAPGLYLTPMLEGLPEAVRSQLGAQVPMPSRLGQPDEYALMAQQIVEQPMLNGEVVRLDGAIRMPPK